MGTADLALAFAIMGLACICFAGAIYAHLRKYCRQQERQRRVIVVHTVPPFVLPTVIPENHRQPKPKPQNDCIIQIPKTQAKELCCICLLELGSSVYKMSCSHVFHAPCIEAWLAEHPTCPMCRQLPTQ